MRIPAFLARLFQPSRRERIAAFDAQLERNLASRKAGRGARQQRSRRGAATKVHKAYANDALMRERVEF